MFELIGGLLYLIFIGIVWVGKILLKVLFYTGPILICIFAFFMGGSLANAIWGGRYSESAVEDSYEIRVTIDWQCSKGTETLTVRRDLQWTTADGKGGGPLFDENGWHDYDGYEAPPTVPVRDGYRFLGLYTSPMGGSMVVSAGGYCVTNLPEGDITLYALWEPVGSAALTDGAPMPVVRSVLRACA